MYFMIKDAFVSQSKVVIQKVSMSIVPFSLIEICCKFYVHSVDKFIHHHIRNSLGTTFSRFLSLSLHHKVLDTEHVISFGNGIERDASMDSSHSRKNSLGTSYIGNLSFGLSSSTISKSIIAIDVKHNAIDRHKSDNVLQHIRAPFCYIPNISWSLPQPQVVSAQSHFDGILGLYADDSHFDYRPCLILFDGSETEGGAGSEITFCRFLSTLPFPSCTMSNQYLFCGPKHGIISEESDGRLYQLKLSDITSSAFRFNLMEYTNGSADVDSAGINEFGDQYGGSQRMCYLSRRESIFAIQSEKHSMNLTKVQCKMYSLPTTQWRAVSEEKFIYSQPNRCGICGDAAESAVYLVDDTRRITLFDIKTQKWITRFDGNERIVQNSKEQKSGRMLGRPSIWFDSEHRDILYAASTRNGSFAIDFFDFRCEDGWDSVVIDSGPYTRLQSCNAIF